VLFRSVKAIYYFCEEISEDSQKNKIIVNYLPRIVEGLMKIVIENCENQIGAQSLETMANVLSLVGDEFLNEVESKVSPLLVAIFLKYSNDPILIATISDIMNIFITNVHTRPKIEKRILPTLTSIISGEQSSNKDLNNLVISSLDLLANILRNTTSDFYECHLVNFVHVANLCLRNDDTAILQSGSECLRAFLFKSSEHIISWKNEEGVSSLNYIILVINHLLDPKICEQSSLFTGRFINTVLRSTGHALGQNFENILKAVLCRLQSSQSLTVQQSLILVFAQLIHHKMEDVLMFLSNIPGPTGQPVFEFFMSEWVSKQNSFVGAYECKIGILALAKLLEHAISKEDVRFQSIMVKGDRVINPMEGIRTRSKSKTESELYTQVPLLVKIYKLLINELNNQIEDSKDDKDNDEYDDDSENSNTEDDENRDEIGDEVTLKAGESEGLNAYLEDDGLEEIFDQNDFTNEDDPEVLADPLTGINLLEYLSSYLQTLSQHPCYYMFSQHHNNIEIEVLKEIGIKL